MNLYPWFTSSAKQFLANKNNLAHAWLISGPAGIGKFEFGWYLTQALLCEKPSENQFACHQCVACQWVQQATHPDVQFIYPYRMQQTLFGELLGHTEQKSQEILINQIRSLDTWLHTTSHRSKYKIVLIYPAHRINLFAANALLKNLEEPNEKTIFFLISSKPETLIPTIRSRCQHITLAHPETHTSLQWLKENGIQQAEQWLAASGYAPLLALKAAKNESAPVPQWLIQLAQGLVQGQKAQIYGLLAVLEKINYGELLTYLQRFIADVHCIQFAQPLRHFPSMQESIQILSNRSTQIQTTHLFKKLIEEQKTASHPFNTKLQLHNLLDNLHRVFC